MNQIYYVECREDQGGRGGGLYEVLITTTATTTASSSSSRSGYIRWLPNRDSHVCARA